MKKFFSILILTAFSLPYAFSQKIIIINVTSSKAAVIGMSKALAKELGPSNIRVNVVAPGWIETDMTKNLPDDAKEAILKGIPMQEMGKPEDIANMVSFLASDKAKYITGQVFCVDGGMAI